MELIKCCQCKLIVAKDWIEIIHKCTPVALQIKSLLKIMNMWSINSNILHRWWYLLILDSIRQVKHQLINFWIILGKPILWQEALKPLFLYRPILLILTSMYCHGQGFKLSKDMFWIGNNRQIFNRQYFLKV